MWPISTGTPMHKARRSRISISMSISIRGFSSGWRRPLASGIAFASSALGGGRRLDSADCATRAFFWLKGGLAPLGFGRGTGTGLPKPPFGNGSLGRLGLLSLESHGGGRSVTLLPDFRWVMHRRTVGRMLAIR